VPELADLDATTGHALLAAWRTHRRRLCGLWIGHEPALVRPAELAWGVPVCWTIAQVRAQLCDYQLAPGCRVTWLAAHGPTAPIPPAAASPGPDAHALAVLDATIPPRLDARAELDAAPGPAADALAGCIAAMRWAIEAFAFGAAFRIGARLEDHRDRLDRAGQAAHAQLTAIAATCAHFVDTATPGFDERLDAMYARAIELAGDPVDAAALVVRRAFAAVERGGANPASHLDAAAARLAQVSDDQGGSYHAAWLAVARALHQLHDAPRAVAARVVEQACATIDQADRHAAAAGVPAHRRDLASARFVILAHAAREAAPGDPDRAARWLAQAARDRAHLPVVHRFEVLHWVLLPQRDDDRAVIYERCVEGIRDAERCWEARAWYLYRALAADSAYRLGRLVDATVHVRALLAIARFGHPGIALVGDLDALARRVLFRAGAVAELAAVTGAAASEAEAQALIARVAAGRGDPTAADAAIEQAIERAVTCGAQAAMCRVAVIAVQVMHALGRGAEACAALDSAWQLAEDEPGAWSAAVAPSDCLRLCLAEAALRGAPAALVERALAVLPACMADADSWWDVDDVLDLLIARPEAAASDLARAGLAVVRRLARNRTTWRARLAALDGARR
jgi:hypothetical protein